MANSTPSGLAAQILREAPVRSIGRCEAAAASAVADGATSLEIGLVGAESI